MLDKFFAGMKSTLCIWEYPVPFWIFLLFFSSVCLWFPPMMFKSLQIEPMLLIVKPYCGLVFFISVIVLIVKVLIIIGQQIRIKWGANQLKKAGIKHLQRLSPAEKNLLCCYILGETKTQYFSIEDGVVKGLEFQGIIYRASDVGDLHGKGFAFNIQPWVWEYLKGHPRLITEGAIKDNDGRIIPYRNRFNIFDTY